MGPAIPANSQAALWVDLSRRVEQRIGAPLPPFASVSTPAFDAVLQRLREVDSVLWREVLDALTGPDVRLPVEDEAEQAQFRERTRRRLFGPLFRPDGLRTGARRLNVRRIFNVAGISVILIGFIWSVAGTKAPTQVSAPTPMTTQDRIARSATPPGPPAQPPVPPTPFSISPLQLATPDAPVSLPPDVPLPPAVPAAPAPGWIPSFDTPPVQQPTPAGPILFQAQRATDATVSPVIYSTPEHDRDVSATSSPVLIYRTGNSSSGDRVQTAGSGGIVAPNGQEPSSQAGLPPAATPSSDEPAFQLGQVLQARLVLQVSVSPAWGAVPVLAELTGGPRAGAVLWGQARMGRDGSIEIAFTQLIVDRSTIVPFNGVAYDVASGRPGVRGQVQTVMPGAAQTILSATLQAASDYFKARVNASTVTITNGFLTIQQSLPSFWDVYSKALAEGMTPTTQTAGPAVVARLSQGAAISVMVLGQ